jgi:iron complex outermembrane receptor protein
MHTYSMACRLARLTGVALAAAPLAAHAEDADDAPAIVVTAAADHPAATVQARSAEDLRETTAVVTADDALRYLPSLFVRRRHIGDTQAPLATRTSGVGSSARSLIYADGVLLSALIGNNNSTASPRWGMVSPEEIERVEVLYGPFSAAYPGNSIGAVVNIATRLPEKTEASLAIATSVQAFDQYGTDDTFQATRIAGTFGTRAGPLALFVAANHLDSRGQPLAYATTPRPAATGGGGAPASGAFEAVNRTGNPVFVLGASGLEHNVQDNLKLKASIEPAAGFRLTYLGGLFLNDPSADARTYLDGDRYAGTFAIGGRTVSVPASAFSNNVYRLDERHWMHALTAEGAIGEAAIRLTGSTYRFDKSEQRVPSGALPAARAGGPGSIVDLGGTGWDTLDLSIARRGTSFGAHRDRVRLQSHRYAAADWLRGAAGALTQAAEGRTTTGAVWAQQALAVDPRLELTFGARYEWWRADRGHNYSLAPALSVDQPELAREGLSPKASLRWKAAGPWSVSLSAAQAYRFPTVQELYQAISTGPTLSVPDPTLRAERARSAELALERKDERGSMRLSLFGERIRDALISQSAPLVAGSTALFNFVQNIPQVRTYGVELAFDRSGVLDPRLDLSGSVTLVDPEIVSDPAFPAAEGKDIPQVPRRRATRVATWRQSGAASFTLAARYASRAFGTIDNSDFVSHTYQSFDGYVLADARALFRLGKGLEAAVGIENLFDERYFEFHPFPGRTFTAEVRWQM